MGDRLANQLVQMIEKARRQGYSEKQIKAMVHAEVRRHGPAALVAAEDALRR